MKLDVKLRSKNFKCPAEAGADRRSGVEDALQKQLFADGLGGSFAGLPCFFEDVFQTFIDPDPCPFLTF